MFTVSSRRPSAWPAVVAALLLGCAEQPSKPTANAQSALASGSARAIELPLAPAVAELPRVRIASGLANPRGMHVTADGVLLVAVAGTGDPSDPATGGLLQLRDSNGDGDYDDAGERSALLDKQPSNNILNIVRRDEVFGMAGVAEGDGMVLASLANFGGPSKVFRVAADGVTPWGSTHGNINSLDYDERRHAWVGTASTTDEVVELLPGGRAERIVKIPALASGQDAVPAYLRYDPVTQDLLVTLFSGSPEGEEGGEGTEIVARSASIVRVHAETHRIEPVVVGLTVPTDLEIDTDGSIYVLEFCDAFLDPVTRREDMQGATMHGGFRRFSGRLIHIDRKTGQATIVARGLDAPSNLTLAGNMLYVAQGMGTPGRSIPGPDGKPVALTGFIERIALH